MMRNNFETGDNDKDDDDDSDDDDDIDDDNVDVDVHDDGRAEGVKADDEATKKNHLLMVKTYLRIFQF